MADEVIASFEFAEAFSGEWAYARVGVTEGKVGLTLSLETDGDVSAFLHAHDCERLVAALQRALQMADVRAPQGSGHDAKQALSRATTHAEGYGPTPVGRRPRAPESDQGSDGLAMAEGQRTGVADRDDLVARMLELIPDLRQSYDNLVDEYQGEDPGLHVIFGDVLNPFLPTLLSGDGEQGALAPAFGLLEEMATSADPDVQNVLAVTVLERLREDQILRRAWRYMGPATRRLSDEIEAGWHEFEARRGRRGGCTLADVIRYELGTGRPVGGKSHIQKGMNYVARLLHLLATEDLSAHDRAVAQALVHDLVGALRLKEGGPSR